MLACLPLCRLRFASLNDTRSARGGDEPPTFTVSPEEQEQRHERETRDGEDIGRTVAGTYGNEPNANVFAQLNLRDDRHENDFPEERLLLSDRTTRERVCVCE